MNVVIVLSNYISSRNRERCAHKKNHERETLYARVCVSNDKTKTKSRKSSLSLSLYFLSSLLALKVLSYAQQQCRVAVYPKALK